MLLVSSVYAFLGPNENKVWGPNRSGGLAGNPRGAWPQSRLAYFWFASAEWKVPQLFAESSNRQSVGRIDLGRFRGNQRGQGMAARFAQREPRIRTLHRVRFG
jgi:hypothetical protein